MPTCFENRQKDSGRLQRPRLTSLNSQGPPAQSSCRPYGRIRADRPGFRSRSIVAWYVHEPSQARRRVFAVPQHTGFSHWCWPRLDWHAAVPDNFSGPTDRQSNRGTAQIVGGAGSRDAVIMLQVFLIAASLGSAGWLLGRFIPPDQRARTWGHQPFNGSAPDSSEPPAPYGKEYLNFMYNLLFCDNPSLLRLRPADGQKPPPWAILLDDSSDPRAVQAFADDETDESRVRCLAFKAPEESPSGAEREASGHYCRSELRVRAGRNCCIGRRTCSLHKPYWETCCIRWNATRCGRRSQTPSRGVAAYRRPTKSLGQAKAPTTTEGERAHDVSGLRWTIFCRGNIVCRGKRSARRRSLFLGGPSLKAYQRRGDQEESLNIYDSPGPG